MNRDKLDDSTRPFQALALFRGLYKRIASKLDVDPSYVSRVARGERKSEIIESALRKEMQKILGDGHRDGHHLDGHGSKTGRDGHHLDGHGSKTGRDGHHLDGHGSKAGRDGHGNDGHAGKNHKSGSATRSALIRSDGATHRDGAANDHNGNRNGNNLLSSGATGKSKTKS
jgi:hypothetical protein